MLNQQLRELLNYNQKTSAQNSELRVEIMSLEQQNDALNSQIQSLENLINDIEEQKNQESIELQRILQFLNEKSVRAYQGSLSERIVKMFDIMDEDLKESQEQMDKLFHDLEECQNQATVLLQDNHKLSNENNDLQQDIEEIQAQMTQISEQLEQIRPQVAHQEQEIEQLEIQNENLQSIKNPSEPYFVDMYNKERSELTEMVQSFERLSRDKEMELYKVAVDKERYQKQIFQKDQLLQSIFYQPFFFLFSLKNQEMQQEFQQMLAKAEESFSSEKHILSINLQELQDIHKNFQQDNLVLQKDIKALELENKSLRDDIQKQEHNYRQIFQQQNQNAEQLNAQMEDEKRKQQQKQRLKRESLEQENLKLNKMNLELQFKINQLESERQQLKKLIKEKSIEGDGTKFILNTQLEQMKRQQTDQDQQIQKLKQHEVEMEHKILILENEKNDLETLVRRQKKLLNQL